MDWRNSATSGTDLYAQRVRANGTVDPAWAVNGTPVVTAPGGQGIALVSSPMPAVPDGAGGAIVVWMDTRNGNDDILAHRVRASGTVDPAWPVDGRAVCTASGDQYNAVAVEDGSRRS